MMNGVLVTREKFYAFINKYQVSVGDRLVTKIQRPLTVYHDEGRKPQQVCWYNDKSCGGDPDQAGRDYYILEELIDYKSRGEFREEMLAEAIDKHPKEMTAIVTLKDICQNAEKESKTGEEYISTYREAVKGCYEKLFQKKTKPASKVGAKKRKRLAPAKRTKKN
jgi:hypothetical protein